MITMTKLEFKQFVKANVGKFVGINGSIYPEGGRIVGYNSSEQLIFITNESGRSKSSYGSRSDNVFLDNGNDKVIYISLHHLLTIDGKKPEFEVDGKCIMFGASSNSNGRRKYKVKVEKKELFAGVSRFVDVEIEGYTLRDAKKKANL